MILWRVILNDNRFSNYIYFSYIINVDIDVIPMIEIFNDLRLYEIIFIFLLGYICFLFMTK